jgi:iron(III) transport system ATP-binding protein
VINPDCLLLDEPLSNLDAKLRLEMRDEIRRIQAETGVTTIYVTHDQKEALSMAGRLSVIVDGKIAQTGSPREVYSGPRSPFVAAFVGETNLISGSVRTTDGSNVTLQTKLGTVNGTLAAGAEVRVGSEATASIRPEDLAPADSEGADNVFVGEVRQYTFLGDVAQLVFASGGQELKALVMASEADEKVRLLQCAPSRVLVFSEASSGGERNDR